MTKPLTCPCTVLALLLLSCGGELGELDELEGTDERQGLSTATTPLLRDLVAPSTTAFARDSLRDAAGNGWVYGGQLNCRFLYSDLVNVLKLVFNSVACGYGRGDPRAAVMDCSTFSSTEECPYHPAGSHSGLSTMDLGYYTFGSSNFTQKAGGVSIWSGAVLRTDVFDWERNWVLWTRIAQLIPGTRFSVDVRIYNYIVSRVGSPAASRLLLPDTPYLWNHHLHTHVHLGYTSTIAWNTPIPWTCAIPRAVCGDNVCSWPENGASCGRDCCDAQTPCGQSRGNLGTYYCRKINSEPYRWLTPAAASPYCDSVAELCASTATCAGTHYACTSLPNGWSVGAPGSCTPRAVCGNSVCEAGESGASCGRDCCDAQTPCSQTRGNLGTHYCRKFNSGPYHWLTQSGASFYCDSTAERCVSTATCAGTLYTCTSLPNGWAMGTCK